MALINRTFYTYRDITIRPCILSKINHRNECNPLDENGFLPLFTAPMDTVVNDENFNLFIENNINAILPRTVSIEARINASRGGFWAAYSLNEFEEYICKGMVEKSSENKIKVLLDIANGHMIKLLELCSEAKEKYGNEIEIMAGNIANPKTYLEYAKVGIDYCRAGIGAGNGCLSTSNTGTHMPMASLIDEIKEYKTDVEEIFKCQYQKQYKSIPKIVADGGIRNYSDAIKALGLGADYVMIGSIFAKMLESAAPKISDMVGNITNEMISSNNIKYEDGQWKLDGEELGEIKATFYGMASKEGQIALNGAKTKTSEGLKKTLKVEYTMSGWVKNFTDYLRSAMSYTGAKTLEDFKNNTDLIVNSENAINVVNK